MNRYLGSNPHSMCDVVHLLSLFQTGSRPQPGGPKFQTARAWRWREAPQQNRVWPQLPERCCWAHLYKWCCPLRSKIHSCITKLYHNKNMLYKNSCVRRHTSVMLWTATMAQKVHGQLLNGASEAFQSRHRWRHDKGSRGAFIWCFYERAQSELYPVHLQPPVPSELIYIHLHRAR